MKHPITFAMTVVAALCAALAVSAAEVSGTVTILKKGGSKPLADHANAVVYLSGGPAAPAPAEPAIVRQQDKVFVPRVLAVVRGQEVRFVNDDEVKHNVFSNEQEKSFDLGYYPKGEYRSQVYDELGRFRVYCNIHRAMICDIVVLDTAHFAVTDEAGKFTIANVPPGDYTLHVWHIFGGETEQPVTVGAEPLVIALSVASEVVLRELNSHKNKFGKSYTSKFGSSRY